MDTVCHKQLSFGSLFSKEIVADFTGGLISSDAGGLVLREIDQRYRLTEKASSCLRDSRDRNCITHDLKTVLGQRVISIALVPKKLIGDMRDSAGLWRQPCF